MSDQVAAAAITGLMAILLVVVKRWLTRSSNPTEPPDDVLAGAALRSELRYELRRLRQILTDREHDCEARLAKARQEADEYVDRYRRQVSITNDVQEQLAECWRKLRYCEDRERTLLQRRPVEE